MRMAVLTEFIDFNKGYSLAGVVSNLCQMLVRYGHDVHLYVGETYKDTYPHPEGVVLHKTTPRFAQKDYMLESELTEEHKQVIQNRLIPFMKSELPQYDVVISQDAVFSGWLMPYFLALEGCIEETKNTLFFHFLNSLPPRVDVPHWDWRNIGRLNKYNNHRLVSFTNHNKELIAKNYKATMDEVVVIPHIIDIRTEGQFCQESKDLIDYMPNILFGDVVCVYPASTDRLQPKQIHACIALFDGFKRRNMRTALVIANQWATGRVPQESKEKYLKFATGLGLVYGQDFLFTSDFNPPKYDAGISKKMLHDLWQCANLFIFPSIEEAYGLVGPEAALTGQYLVVNNDVGCFKEIYGDCVQYENFGSLEHCDFYGKSGDEIAEYLDNMSQRILEGMVRDKSIMAKTRVRINNNLDAIYLNFWEPLIRGC